MCFNKQKTEIAVISSNGYIHCWDANTFKQVMSKKLPHNSENRCLAVDEDNSMYAVGSKANTDLIDARALHVINELNAKNLKGEFDFEFLFQCVKKIPSRNNQSNIRSVSFKGNILTIGNGSGVVLFWDLRAGKFLESTVNTNRSVNLKASRGWVVSLNILLFLACKF